jgi:hypothetical protein
VRRSPLGAGAKSLERNSTFKAEPKPLARTSPLAASTAAGKRSTLKPGKGFACSPAQRSKVEFAPCVRCAREGCHPAHVIDRSIAPDPAGDPRAVVPLCPECHRLYDTGVVSILEHLEPHYRAELAFAVERVGLIPALERVTNSRWRPLTDLENG